MKVSIQRVSRTGRHAASGALPRFETLLPATGCRRAGRERLRELEMLAQCRQRVRDQRPNFLTLYLVLRRLQHADGLVVAVHHDVGKRGIKRRAAQRLQLLDGRHARILALFLAVPALTVATLALCRIEPLTGAARRVALLAVAIALILRGVAAVTARIARVRRIIALCRVHPALLAMLAARIRVAG